MTIREAAACADAPIVALAGVGKTFPNGVVALDGFDLSVRSGEFLTLLGPSGCGKTTALRIMAGLGEPDSGAVEWSNSEAGAARRQIGFVFQEPTLMPWASVAANVHLPLRLLGAEAGASARIGAALDRGGLAGFAQAYPRELSVGLQLPASIAL